MSKFKKVGIITLLTALLVTNTANAAVIGDVTKSQKSKDVKVSLSAKTISVGKSAKIKISFPAKAKKKKVTYKAVKGGIVSVKKDGSVLGKKAGKEKIKIKIQYRIGKKKWLKKKQVAITVTSKIQKFTPDQNIPISTELPVVNPYEEENNTVPNVTTKPSTEPAVKPSTEPTVKPSAEPTVTPSVEPTVKPSAEPTATPNIEPIVTPSAEPTVKPSAEPIVTPSIEPTVKPSAEPTVEPSAEPTATPNIEPTVQPSAAPTNTPKPSIQVVTMGGSNETAELEQLEVCPTELCGNDGCYVQPMQGMNVTYENGEQTYFEFALSGSLFHYSTDGITAKKIPFTAIIKNLSSALEKGYWTKNVVEFYGDGVMEAYMSCVNVKNIMEAFSGKKVTSIQPSENMKAYIVK